MDDPRLGEILVLWEEAEIDGESVSIEDLCEGNPDLVKAARRRIDQLKAMDTILDGTPNSDEGSTIEATMQREAGPRGRATGSRWAMRS